MAKLIDCSIPYFLEYIKDKEIIAFGAGRKFVKFVSDFSLEEKINYVVDNDRNKVGTILQINDYSFNVVSVEYMLDHYSDNAVILITNMASFAHIVVQLDGYPQLAQARCFSACLMMDYCKPEEITYTTGIQRIPKMIHYCWFGGAEIPDKLQKCIESWSKYCPDYEIIRWDESNYDITKNEYMREAYLHKMWGFVPDYARLDIIATHGGIYLDTDVEIVKSFDDLLRDRSFWGFSTYCEINCGCGFGAERGNNLVMKLRDYYDDKHFVNPDGSINNTSCITYQQPVFLEYGFRMNNTQQNIAENTVYPMEVFAPQGALAVHKCITSHTHSIHHCARTWESKQNNRDYNDIHEMMKKITVEERR